MTGHPTALVRARLAAAAALLALCACPAPAESPQHADAAPGTAKVTVGEAGARPEAAIEGAVFDPHGDPVTEARVTVVDEASGEAVRAGCDTSGAFRVAPLAPGSYTLKIAASGLRTFVRRGIALGQGQDARLDVTLKSGEMGDEDAPERAGRSRRRGNVLLAPVHGLKKILPGVDR
jgi:hypothetical protein